MSKTLHIDFGEQPVTRLYGPRDMSALVSSDGDIIRTSDDVADASNRCITTTAALGENFGPAYKIPANGISGKSAGLFNGTNSHGVPATEGGPGVGPTGFLICSDFFTVSEKTIMMVFQADAGSVSGNPGTSNFGRCFISDGGLEWIINFYTNAGVHQLYAKNSSGTVGPIDFLLNVPNLLVMRQMGGNVFASINKGAELSASSSNIADAHNNVWIGVSFAYGVYFSGRIGEIKLYDTGDADGQLNAQKNTLMAKWGITRSGGAGAGKGSKGNKGGGGVTIITPGSPIVCNIPGAGTDISST